MTREQATPPKQQDSKQEARSFFWMTANSNEVGTYTEKFTDPGFFRFPLVFYL